MDRKTTYVGRLLIGPLDDGSWAAWWMSRTPYVDEPTAVEPNEDAITTKAHALDRERYIQSWINRG